MLSPRRFRVELLDGDGDELVPDVADVIRLEFSQRWCADGSWSMTVPSSSETAAAVLDGDGLTRLVVTDRDTGHVVFSGPVQPSGYGLRAVWRRRIETTPTGRRDVLTVSGWDDWAAILGPTPALPKPTLVPAGGPVAYDDRSGPASTVAWGYVDANVGGAAAQDRGWPTLVMASDPVIGATVSERARYWPLGALVRRICVAGGITATLQQGDPGGAFPKSQVFELSAPADRSDRVRFSAAAGSLLSAEIVSAPSPANTVWVLGQGQLAARDVEFVDVSPGVSRGQRREGVLDRTDLPTSAQLVTAGETWLEDRGGEPSVSIVPAETPGTRLGVDFQLGDLVGVEFDGVSSGSVRVTGADWTMTADGVRRRLLVGAGRVVGVDGLVARFAELERRIDTRARV